LMTRHDLETCMIALPLETCSTHHRATANPVIEAWSGYPLSVIAPHQSGK
jgi:hypothetical protein